MSDSITVVAGLARGGIGTETGKDFIWVNGAGTALTKVGLNGTVLATPLSTSFAFGYPNDSVHTAYHTSTYFEHNGGKFVAITGRNSASYGKVFALYDVTNSETTPTLYGFDTLGNVSNTNGNATGDISVKKNGDGSVTLFHVVTNNGIASWTTTLAPLPVELSSFNASVSGTNVTLNWKTATEKNANQFVVEKNTNSIWTEIGYVKAVGTSTTEQSYSFTDKNFVEGNISYRLKIVDFDGSYEYSNVIEVDVERVIDYSLAQNYPNPFNPTTTIDFQIPSNGFVSLKVYDLLGKEVATLINEVKTSGKHSVEFNASELASGIYLYELRSGSFLSTKKLVLMK
ncbi:MAG: T9SS type A sorting domain-containing protein [Ignavibacteriaceae bacterium]|nr:T9SS type A sorting domain-containing protein [Ignavibacteriaceae bacterium]